jgi:hypothetical protein
MLFVVFITACTKTEDQTTQFISSKGTGGWFVPTEDLVIKKDAHDKIQSIDAPLFYSFEEAQLDHDEKVFIYKANNHINIYPLEILWHHEIINDKYLDDYFSITYCPLTGSSIAWDRTINGEPTTFGVSGHLYNHNLVPYDRATESYWSQIGQQSIHGPLSGHALETKPLLLTTAAIAQESFPSGSVLNDTSVNACDSVCLLSNIKSGNGTKSHLLPKDEYFGVVFRQYALLFEEDMFTDTINIYKINFKTYRLLIVGSKTKHFITAFLLPSNQSNSNFSPVQDELPIIMKDDSNNLYDLMGTVIGGPDTGMQLDSPPSFWAKSFAWELFYPELNIYEK